MDNCCESSVLDSFNIVTKKPDAYLRLDGSLPNRIKLLVKSMYNYSVNENGQPKSYMLPELIIDNFDTEQIWQQVELKNHSMINNYLCNISKLLVQKDKLLFLNLLNSFNNISRLNNIENDDAYPEDKLGSDSNNKKNEANYHQVVTRTWENDIEMKEANDSSAESDESDHEDYRKFIFEHEEEVNGEQHLSKDSEEIDIEKEKVKEMEEFVMQEKEWQMKGEVSCEDRPEYSLLEHNLGVDIIRKPSPVITEKTTLRLEEIIKQRIKDRAFDSVVQKEKQIETPLEYKKKLVLEQEKSQYSLAQIYENEYLRKQETSLQGECCKEEPSVHREIQSKMADLFSKLDALSNYHFTPKPAALELKVISNLPSIAFEEVTPVPMSDAMLLAPEEVKSKPKGDLLGESERTESDEKRQRRKKKQNQKLHSQKINEPKVSHDKPRRNNKLIGWKIGNIVQQIAKKKKSSKVPKHFKKTIKSTTAFFDQLEEVQSQIQNKCKVNSIDHSSNKKKLYSVACQ